MNLSFLPRLVILQLFLDITFLVRKTKACYSYSKFVRNLHKEDAKDFLYRWKVSKNIIYKGDSVKELLSLCPGGCKSGCTFDVYPPPGNSTPPSKVPCDENTARVLKKAQEIVRGWQEVIKNSKSDLIISCIQLGIIVILILILIIRGHYRIRHLWFLPADRQWELERDPVNGLPGKVWNLLRFRVVKSDKKEPTERKYLSYTENPTVMGNKFWYYKHTLRQMYRPHKYYKRTRYFHKLAWQIIKMGKLIPETLRPHREKKRLAAELERLHSSPSTPTGKDPKVNLPWEVDLADELNTAYLHMAKQKLNQAIEKYKARGTFVRGRYQPRVGPGPSFIDSHHHHHHHHHKNKHLPPPLTKPEVLAMSKKHQVAVPNASDYVNVQGIMKLLPTSKNKDELETKPRHHHHHHNKREKEQLKMFADYLKQKQEMEKRQKEEEENQKNTVLDLTPPPPRLPFRDPGMMDPKDEMKGRKGK